jgi:short-subunit dehydrogenase
MTQSSASDSQPGAGAPRPVAVVTGASSGIGLEYAERLAEQGNDLVVVARRKSRLDALAVQLREDHRIDVDVIAADLTKPEDLRAVEERVAEELRLETLINCAGFGTVSHFVAMSAERAEEEIALNVTALVRLTRAAVPGMIDRGRGRVVNVSSMASFQPNPYLATYGATKAYVTSFTEALAEELKGTGVSFQALCPGPVRTEFGDVAGVSDSVFPDFAYSTPDEVVAASMKALASGAVVCVPRTSESALASIMDVLPRTWVRKISGGIYRRTFSRRD